jgi:hypothetical protein
MGWWFGCKSAPADARPFVPAWLQNDAAEEGSARFLTFQVSADDEAPTAGSILCDATSNAIADVAGRSVIGYATARR